MKITLNENNEIILAAADLAAFAASKVKPSRLAFSESFSNLSSGELMTPLSYKIIKGGEVFVVTGEHNGIFNTAGGLAVEKTKRVKRLTSRTTPFSDAKFLAEALVTAFLACKARSAPDIILRMTFQSDSEKKSFELSAELSYLTLIFDSLLDRAAPFASVLGQFEKRGRRDIERMPFPYSSMREGQRDFINEAFRTIKNGGRLLASAPTGIGKTVSSIFPAVKALGQGRADKIFYLTAKTITGKNALDVVRSMNRSVPDLRAVSIIAKERCCPAKKAKSTLSVDRCTPSCPRLSDSADGSYEVRRNRALCELLKDGTVYDSRGIAAAAEKYSLCPYELSLDLSEYCQLIVCDYNYIFDTRVRFRRYFTEVGLRYILLIDESHNLPDRAREMYFASLREETFSKLCEGIKKYFPGEEGLLNCAENACGQFAVIRELCRRNAEFSEGGSFGYCIENEIPKGFTKPFYDLHRAVGKVIPGCDIEEMVKLFDTVRSGISDLAHAEEFFDEHFAFFGESGERGASFRIICLDSSEILDNIMKGAVCSVLFSATLTPLDYFADILGCRGAATLELESPFDPDNLCLAAIDTVSTKLSARDGTAAQIANLILTAVSVKEGNYLVYFPSYKYMKSIVREFLAIAPHSIRAVMQKPDMTLAAREKFLSFFSGEGGGTLVGFCVLGGVFSEGIDLPDERLIGAVLVGIGLPGLSSELNILKEYYDRTREDGYNFAYVYPGMTKILQAAGRVIRSERDRGVVVLIDERYADPSIRKIFPSHWKHMRFVGNSYSLSKLLDSFWNK